MLYNPHNVALEGSPVTTRLELKVAAQLTRMIGYDPARSWGHLTSGGTIANSLCAVCERALAGPLAR